MIFQPTNVIPSNFAGVGLGVVDATKNVNISWQVNGNSPMTAYRIKIYNNAITNPAQNLVKDTGIITTNIPDGGFYGIDQNGNPQQFTYTPEVSWDDDSWGITTNGGIFNGNQYKMIITQWWGTDITESSTTQITQWSGSIFECKEDLIVAVDTNFIKGTLYVYITNQTVTAGAWYYTDDDKTFYFELPNSIKVGESFCVEIASLTETEINIFYYYQGKLSNIVATTTPIDNANNILDYVVGEIRQPGIGFINSPTFSFIGGIFYLELDEDGFPDQSTDEADVAIDWVQWDLWTWNPVTKQKETMIFQTPKINTQKLAIDLNVLQQNNFYNIRCTIQTQDGRVFGGGVAFLVWYNLENFNAQTTICSSRLDGSLLIDINNQDSQFTKYALYLKGDAQERFIYQQELSANSQIKIFSLKNNSAPNIDLFGINEQGQYSNPIDLSCSSFFNDSYYLYETVQDDTYYSVYHVNKVWRFSNNITYSNLTNNNAPNWLTNYTPYRLRQPSSRMGKSGTLQALLSNYNQSENFYEDTAQLMDELFQASQSNNVFFLKDIKGNLFMIGISAPITQTINTKTKLQEVKVSIPWEEVGDASNVSVIQLPTDSGWQQDQVFNAYFEVDLLTGMLSLIYPNNYVGSTFVIEDNELIANTPLGVNAANLTIEDASVIASDMENN